MLQWGKAQTVRNVKLLPDGSGHFTRCMGMLIDKDHVGFGVRSWRYAMLADGNRVTHWFEEPGINDDRLDSDPNGGSAPEAILAAVTGGAASKQAA